MSKKLNLITVAIVLSLGLSGCGKKSAEDYTTSIQSYIAAKTPQSAVIELKSAIQDFPQDPSFRQQLGLLALQYGDMGSAEKELKKAIELGAIKNQLAVPLFRAMYYGGNLKDTANLYLNDPDIAETTQTYLTVFRILSEISADNTENLRERLDTLVAAENQTDLVAYGQSQLQILGGNPKEALEAVSKVKADSPIYIEALLLKARLQHSIRDFKDSVATFSEAEKLLPNNLLLQLMKTQALVDGSENEAAKLALAPLLKNMPDHPLVNYLSAVIAYDEKDFNNAKNYVEKAISYGINDPSTRVLAALCNVNLNLSAQALAHFNAAKSLVQKSEELTKIYNSLLLKSGRSSEVHSQLLNNEAADPQMLAATAYQLIREGSLDSARQLIEQKLSTKNSSVQDIAALAALKLGFQETEKQGMQELEDILKVDPGQDAARTVLAQSFLRQKQYAKAELLADEWLKDPAKAIVGYNLKAYSAVLQNKLADAKAMLENAQKAEPDNSFTLLLMSGLAAKEQRPGDAQTHLETILTKDPSYIPAITQYYSMLKTQDKVEIALQKLQQLVSANPELTQTRSAVAGILLLENQPDKVIEILTSDKTTKVIPATYKNLLIEAYARVGKNDDMLRLSEEQIEENPEDVRTTLIHAKALATTKNYDKAESLLKKLIQRRPDNQQLLETLFLLMLQQDKAAEALDVMAKITPSADKEDEYQLLKGRLLFKTNQFDSAISTLQAAYSKKPNPGTALLLAEVLATANKKNQASSLLKEHVAKHPNDVQVSIVYANLVSTTAPEEASRIYQQSLQAGTKNLMILNNYAWILFQKGELAEALKYAEQAVALDERSADALDTLGSILLAKGETEAAIVRFEKSLSLRPEFAEVQLHLAAALIKANRKPDAGKLLASVKPTEAKLQAELVELKNQLR